MGLASSSIWNASLNPLCGPTVVCFAGGCRRPPRLPYFGHPPATLGSAGRQLHRCPMKTSVWSADVLRPILESTFSRLIMSRESDSTAQPHVDIHEDEALSGRDGIALCRAIKAFTAAVELDSARCCVASCPFCNFRSDKNQLFKRHASRPRLFLIVVGQTVHAVKALLSRWRCPKCRRTFTCYPTFALPRRRYTLPQIRRLAAAYLQNAPVSYRRSVQESRLPIYYAAESTVDAEQGATSLLDCKLAHLPGQDTLRTFFKERAREFLLKRWRVKELGAEARYPPFSFDSRAGSRRGHEILSTCVNHWVKKFEASKLTPFG